MSADAHATSPHQVDGADALDAFDRLDPVGMIFPGALSPGMSVEVFNRFSRRWVTGFEIAEAGTNGYRVRRCSDRSVLPVEVAAGDVRAAHHSSARSARG